MNDPAFAKATVRQALDGFPCAVVSANEALEQEFEARLRDSGTLAFRVAYGVLRHREDAEDVAQESLAKARPDHLADGARLATRRPPADRP